MCYYEIYIAGGCMHVCINITEFCRPALWMAGCTVRLEICKSTIPYLTEDARLFPETEVPIQACLCARCVRAGKIYAPDEAMGMSNGLQTVPLRDIPRPNWMMTIVTLPSVSKRFSDLLGIDEWVHPQTPGMELPDPLIIFPKKMIEDTEDELVMQYPWHTDGHFVSLEDPNDEHGIDAESLTIEHLHAIYDLNCGLGEFDRMWVLDEKRKGRTCVDVWCGKFSQRGMAWEAFQMLWAVIDLNNSIGGGVGAAESAGQEAALSYSLGDVAPSANTAQSSEPSHSYPPPPETTSNATCPEPFTANQAQGAGEPIFREEIPRMPNSLVSYSTYPQVSLLSGASVYCPHLRLAVYGGTGQQQTCDSYQGQDAQLLPGHAQQHGYGGLAVPPPYVARVTPVPLPSYVRSANGMAHSQNSGVAQGTYQLSPSPFASSSSYPAAAAGHAPYPTATWPQAVAAPSSQPPTQPTSLQYPPTTMSSTLPPQYFTPPPSSMPTGPTSSQEASQQQQEGAQRADRQDEPAMANREQPKTPHPAARAFPLARPSAPPPAPPLPFVTSTSSPAATGAAAEEAAATSQEQQQRRPPGRPRKHPLPQLTPRSSLVGAAVPAAVTPRRRRRTSSLLLPTTAVERRESKRLRALREMEGKDVVYVEDEDDE